MSKTTFDYFETDIQGILLKPDYVDESTVVVHANGYIDTYNSTAVGKQCSKLLERGFKNLIINCNHLDYMSSTGIGIFVDLLKQTKARKGNIILTSMSLKVLEVFKLLGFQNYFMFAKSCEDAIDQLSSSIVEIKQSIFPKTIKCLFCKKSLKAPKSGKFKCPSCKEIIVVDPTGKVTL